MKRIINYHYNDYTTNVSYEGMPISYETAVFLWDFLLKYRPNRILERGSGFSTFIFALYKELSNLSIYIYSFDTHIEWWNETEMYLKNNGLYNIDKCSVSEGIPPEKFDLIFEDAKSKKRYSDIDRIPECLKQDGNIIFDDAHKKKNNYIERRMNLQNLSFKRLKFYTDRFGRYPGISRFNKKQRKD